jgi:hypothetical protein
MVASNTWVVTAAGVLAVIGLIINVTVDRDNIFDMTTMGLFAVTFIVAFAGAYLTQRRISSLENRRISEQQQSQVSRTA